MFLLLLTGLGFPTTPSFGAAVVVPEPTLTSTPVEQGYRDFSYGNNVYHRPTAEKPQSKLWWNDGLWWGCLWDPSENAYRIHKLDTAAQSWSSVGPNADNTADAIVDVKWDGTFLYILAHPFESNGPFVLHSYSYDAASDTYSLRAGFPVSPNEGNAEAATLDKDSTGKLWITWADGGDVMINASQGSDTSWGTPFVLPVQGGSASSDDISAVAAFGGQIGVMWSNQQDERVYFAIHNDGDPDGTWQAREDALGGPGEGAVADDHLNLALTSDSGANVYAVVKTSIGLPGEPRVMMIHRDPSGTWADYVVGRDEDDHTRPIMVIDEENRQIYVFAKSDTGDNSIRMKTSDLDNIGFSTGPGQMFIQSNSENDVNNPTSTKQTLNGDMDLLVLASDGSARVYMHNFIDLPGGGGTGSEPDIVAAPSAHDFGDVDVGSSAAQAVRVFNVGTAALDVSATTLVGGEAGEFGISSGAAPFTVAPGDSHDVEVTFAPANAGAETATLDLVSNDPDTATLVVTLDGNGIPIAGPDIDVLPAAHDYGDLAVGMSSPCTFWVHNRGTASLDVGSTSLEGAGAGSFSFDSGDGSFTLAPGDSHAVVVRFAPSALEPYSAVLRLQSDDPDEDPFDVALSGRGGIPAQPDIVAAPSLQDWGAVLVGGVATRALEIQNAGDASLDVSDTSIGGVDAALFNITGGAGAFTLAPGESHQLTMEFVPLSLGNKLATLVVTSNDPDESTLNVLLRGEGVDTISAGGEVTLADVLSGSATSSLTVTTTSSPAAVPNDLYLASIATKNLEQVASVTGMGLTWSLVAKQCGARGQTGVEVWMARGAAPVSDNVTATFEATASAAVISVSRYSGVHATTPLGVPVTASTHGISGACDDLGTDSAAYAVPITTVAANGRVFGAIAKRHKEHTPGTGWVEQSVAEGGSGGSVAGVITVDSTLASPGPVTLSGSFDSPVDWAVVVVEIIPEPADTSSDVRPSVASRGARLQVIAGQDGRIVQLVSPEPTRLRLTVHDVRGRLVRTLWNGAVPEGVSEFEWQRGSRHVVPAGVYFVRAATTRGVLATKLLVMQ